MRIYNIGHPAIGKQLKVKDLLLIKAVPPIGEFVEIADSPEIQHHAKLLVKRHPGKLSFQPLGKQAVVTSEETIRRLQSRLAELELAVMEKDELDVETLTEEPVVVPQKRVKKGETK